jgi:hypothetical protein
MSTSLHLPKTKDRSVIYAALADQLGALLYGEQGLIANQAIFLAALKEAFGFFFGRVLLGD